MTKMDSIHSPLRGGGGGGIEFEFDEQQYLE